MSTRALRSASISTWGVAAVARVFESKNGAGIKLKKTYFEVNGEEVATPLSGSSKKQASFRYTANRKTLGCRVILGVSGQDQAASP